MQINIRPGEKLVIGLQDDDGFTIDGTFTVELTATRLEVTAEFPDTSGRGGVIYSENFGSRYTLHHGDAAYCGDRLNVTDPNDPSDDDWILNPTAEIITFFSALELDAVMIGRPDCEMRPWIDDRDETAPGAPDRG